MWTFFEGIKLRYYFTIWVMLFATPTFAESLDVEKNLSNVETHAFVSQGFIYSTENNYLTRSTNGSFDFTEAGINFSKQLSDELRMGMQFFSRSLGPTGSYDAKFDWYYLDYHWSDALKFKAGRVKIPFGLYNDMSDIDSARVPILLPQSIYPSSNRDFLLAQTGIDIYGYIKMGGGGGLDYHLYSGTIDIEVNNVPSSPLQVDSTNVPYLVGSRVIYETPLNGLRFGASAQTLRLDIGASTNTAPATKFDLATSAFLWVLSGEYTQDKFLFATEYSRWQVESESSAQGTFPSSKTISERAYGMASYRMTDKLQPGMYYSVLYPNQDSTSDPGDVQHDIAGTIRYDVNPNWLLKFEGHYMSGTAGVSPSLNGNTARDDLPEHWSVFMIKTTVYY
jgi:hypothetical protein